MATDEGEFKQEFRKALLEHYPDLLMWTNTDMLRSGLPDISVLRDKFWAIEAKFTKQLPKRKTSKTLSHEVSPAQAAFLKKVQQTGNKAIILIGMPNVAVVTEEIKSNYTLDDLLKGKRILKVDGKWQVRGFFDEQK